MLFAAHLPYIGVSVTVLPRHWDQCQTQVGALFAGSGELPPVAPSLL